MLKKFLSEVWIVERYSGNSSFEVSGTEVADAETADSELSDGHGEDYDVGGGGVGIKNP